MIKTLQTILRQDRERFIIPKGVQEIIPVNRIWSDGIFKSGNVYTKTFKFSDINYAMLSKEDTQTLFLKYCDLINSFECGSTYKLTIALSRDNQKALNESIILPMCCLLTLQSFRQATSSFLPARMLPAAKVIARTPGAAEQANASAGCRYTMLPYTSTASF